MSKPGTTWFRSKRKLVAIAAGAAILAGTVGAVAPQADVEIASTWSYVEMPADTDIDVTIDADIKIDSDKRDPKPAPKPKPWPPYTTLKSTWS